MEESLTSKISKAQPLRLYHYLRYRRNSVNVPKYVKKQIKNFNQFVPLEKIPKIQDVFPRSKKAQTMMAYLEVLSMEGNGDLKITNKKLAKMFQCSERYVQKILSRAVKYNLLKILVIRLQRGRGVMRSDDQYNKYDTKEEKKRKRKFYASVRHIRVNRTFAMCGYNPIYDLGYRTDFRPFFTSDIAKAKSKVTPPERSVRKCRMPFVYDNHITEEQVNAFDMMEDARNYGVFDNGINMLGHDLFTRKLRRYIWLRTLVRNKEKRNKFYYWAHKYLDPRRKDAIWKNMNEIPKDLEFLQF